MQLKTPNYCYKIVKSKGLCMLCEYFKASVLTADISST